MKTNKISIAIIAIITFFVTSCTVDVPVKPSSNGKTCEIVVVSSQKVLTSSIYDSIKAYFMRQNPYLPQAEPLFTVVPLTQMQFNSNEMFRHLRNLIIINIGSFSDKKEFMIYKDNWATNQMIFEFNLTNTSQFQSVFGDKKELIEKAFLNGERERMKRVFKSVENTDISDLLIKHFDFKMTFPEGFRVLAKNDSIIALSKDTKDYTQTILLYTYRYEKQSFKQENILKHRNFLGKTHIQSGIDSAYMGTEMRVPVASDTINFCGKFAVRTQGLWRFYGDFLGGPFQNYVFLDEKTNKIVMIDSFLYAPQKDKRDLLMQLEGIVYSMTSI
ncbi:MAG: DUF4837 family protein [Bacteroidales bacterium]|jgi:hypothetical protein|nr:DUF4837 family protein [Bacteroidales bacterium]